MQTGSSEVRKRGLFIVFEGLDRSGKSTQTKLLAQHLGVEQIAFPNRQGCESGKLLDAYLKNAKGLAPEATHLLFAMNRWEMKSFITEKLTQGTTVVCDRYAYSGIAYSVAKGLDFNWCKGADRGLLKPDIVFYIDNSAEEISKRAGFGEERFERLDFQTKVAEAYTGFKTAGVSHEDVLGLEESQYQSQLNNGQWINIDASGDKSIEDIHDIVKKCVDRYNTDNVPLEKLETSLFVNE